MPTCKMATSLNYKVAHLFARVVFQSRILACGFSICDNVPPLHKKNVCMCVCYVCDVLQGCLFLQGGPRQLVARARRSTQDTM